MDSMFPFIPSPDINYSEDVTAHKLTPHHVQGLKSHIEDLRFDGHVKFPLDLTSRSGDV